MKGIVIFDLDNTLSNGWARAHHIYKAGGRDWESWLDDCINDTPNHCAIELLKAMRLAGHEIWIFTSRGEEKRDQTIEWLHKYGIEYDILEMRPVGEREDDLILKKVWLYKHANTPEIMSRILFVVEDRTRVVQMWRTTGLRCFQVEQNDF